MLLSSPSCARFSAIPLSSLFNVLVLVFLQDESTPATSQRGKSWSSGKNNFAVHQVPVFFNCCLLRGSCWFGWSTWHCKHSETAAKLQQPEKTEPHPHMETLSFLLLSCASWHCLKSCSFRMFLCVYFCIRPSLWGHKLFFFFPSEILMLRRTGKAGCVPFFFYTTMSDGTKKKGGKIRERCLDAIPWSYSWDKNLSVLSAWIHMQEKHKCTHWQLT